MNLEEMKARRAEIEGQDGKGGLIDKETDPAKIDALGQELRSLIEKIAFEEGTITGEHRARAKGIAENGTPVPMGGTPAPREPSPKMSRKSAVSLLVGLAARKKLPTEVQKRAVDEALTTTATEYIAASVDQDGVNNAGVLIPTRIVRDYLVEEAKVSPIVADIAFTAVKGLITKPYRVKRTKANAKGEGKGTAKNQFEMGKLTLVQGWLQIVIVVTDEVRALTDIDLGAYILDNIVKDLNQDWAEELIYGTGVEDSEGFSHVAGVTKDATAISYAAADGYLNALISGIEKCETPFRDGAKAYVSREVYNKILFEKDSTGRYQYQILNNTVGISSIGDMQVVVDENLNAGDFLIGNVSKWYSANMLLPMSVEEERDTNRHTTQYVAAQFLAAAPFVTSNSKAFIHGKKSA